MAILVTQPTKYRYLSSIESTI